MNGLFGNLANDLAAQSVQPGVMPGAGANPATNKKSGLLGLGGPGVGLIDKFIKPMFGGNDGATAAPMQTFDAGGQVTGTGGGNPYSDQVTAMDQRIEATKHSILTTFQKDEQETAMEEAVTPLREQRQELANLSRQWQQKQDQQVKGGNQQQNQQGQPMQTFDAGGQVTGTGGGNPYADQITALDQQVETAKHSIVTSVPKEEWQTYMEEGVFPIMRKRDELAKLSRQWQQKQDQQVKGGKVISQVQQNQQGQQVQQNQQVQPVQTFNAGGQVMGQGGGKSRRIIIEEKPSNI